MTLKDDAEEIKSLTLVPVCCSPNSGDSRYAHVCFVKQNLQPQPVIFGGRKQMIVNFETRLFLHTSIGAAKVRKEIKLGFRAGFERRK